MNISYNWLKRYIDCGMQPKELAAALTSVGLECDTVEEVESIRGGLRGLVAGKVITCVDHPDSDHLHVTTVDLGDGNPPVQIVCGAPNVAAGQTVIVAPVGCVLYDGDKEFRIKKSRMRGQESLGMICAEDEIGVGNSHDGIIVLDDSVEAGTPAARIFGIESDWRLEVELTPNRVDAASHYGVARDLKALFARTAIMHNGPEGPAGINTPDDSAFSVDRPDGATGVRVEDTAGCPRYSGVTVRGVKVAESPEWLRRLLEAAGQRPINNIVDITNFVLLGLGQPLHCFDLGQVNGDIRVATCPQDTPFVTLDGVERKLDATDLVICDDSRPLALAGVFGGLDSGVTDATTDIFIESACFNPTRVRRTARRHGLSTDASFRYERGTDPSVTVYAARLAACLVRELAGGEICGDVTDILSADITKAEVDFSLDYCDSLIGKAIPRDLVVAVLRALDFDVESVSGNDRLLKLRVPTYRVDVTRPCDVVEEILRIYGYNNVETPLRLNATLSQRGATDMDYEMQQLVSDRLSACGFNEILNNSLSSASYYEDCSEMPISRCVRLLNPLSGDLSVMRQSLLFGGLESLAHNINRRASDLCFYEFGNVYFRDPDKDVTADRPLAPFSEEARLGLWMTGDMQPASWDHAAVAADVFRMRETVEGIFSRLGVPEGLMTLTQDSDGIFAARVDYRTRDGKTVASVGVLRHSLLKRFDIGQSVVFAEIRWNELVRIALRAKVTFAPLPKTLPVRRDMALLLDSGVSFASVEQTVRKAGGKLLRSVSLFDVYEGDRLPAGKKSYAVRVELQDPEKTLLDKQIDSVMKKIVDALAAQLHAEQR